MEIDVSRETLDRIEHFEGMLARWTAKINLVSKSTISEIRERHTNDSLQLVRFAPKTFDVWADFGSGGGLPALVLACVFKETVPDATMILVESDQRKSAFLRSVVRECELNAKVLADRAEELPSLHADVVSARALSSLDDLLGLAALHMSPDGCAIFPKGRRFHDEIEAAQRNWNFDVAVHPSVTDNEARILVCKDIERAKPRI